jgi:hypothetical protein
LPHKRGVRAFDARRMQSVRNFLNRWLMELGVTTA